MNMLEIQAALEKRLATMTPELATAYENEVFTPVTGTPYQKITQLPNNPVDHAISLDVTEDRGIFQVSLMYPIGSGRGAAQARAQAIRDHFPLALVLTEGTTKVEVSRTVSVGTGYPDGDRYMVPVSIYWKSYS